MPLISAILRVFLRLTRDELAGMTVMVALALPALIGASGLAFDLNRGLQQRMTNQRVADMAALGAAMAYLDAGEAEVIQPTAAGLALANGLASAEVETALLPDYPAAGEQAVRVKVEQRIPFVLARVLGITGSYPVAAQSIASVTPGESSFAAPCYLALSPGDDAFTVSGGASVEAPSCAVAAIGRVANNGQLIKAADIISGSDDIYLNYGTLDAATLRFAGIFDKPRSNDKAPPAEAWINEETTLGDPWAQDPARLAAMSLIGDYAPVSSLGNPDTPSGSNWSFDGSATGPAASYRQSASGNYVVPAGNYTIGRLETGGGMNIRFGDGSRITVSDGVSIGGGTTVDFGDSDVYVNGGFNSGSSGVTIGDGDLWIGSGAVAFAGTNRKGDGEVIINATVQLGGGQNLVMGQGGHHFGRLVVGGGGTALLGPGNFTAVSGVKVDGGSELALGRGDVLLGPYSDESAIKLAGSAKFIMGDGAFSANGDIATSGGSRLVFGVTDNHYVNGDVTIAGSVLFGRGRYTIAGNFNNGTGGTQWPYTSPLTGLTYGQTLEGESVAGFDQAGIGVTFVLSGTMNLGGGARTRLDAPASSNGGGIAELLLSSPSTSASNWNAGSNNRFAGTIHLPNSAVTMAGGNSTIAQKCLSLVAAKIAISGGAATGSACARMSEVGASSGRGSVGLIG